MQAPVLRPHDGQAAAPEKGHVLPSVGALGEWQHEGRSQQLPVRLHALPRRIAGDGAVAVERRGKVSGRRKIEPVVVAQRDAEPTARAAQHPRKVRQQAEIAGVAMLAQLRHLARRRRQHGRRVVGRGVVGDQDLDVVARRRLGRQVLQRRPQLVRTLIGRDADREHGEVVTTSDAPPAWSEWNSDGHGGRPTGAHRRTIERFSNPRSSARPADPPRPGRLVMVGPPSRRHCRATAKQFRGPIPRQWTHAACPPSPSRT